MLALVSVLLVGNTVHAGESVDESARAATLERIRNLARIGAPNLALELADRNPGLLPAAEREAIASNRTAILTRWGAIGADMGRGPTRFEILDRAIAESDAAGARALDPNAVLNAPERQLALDRIGALRDRFRMQEAVTLYEAMATRTPAVPWWAQSSAASAYLYLKQPEKSRDLYRAVLSNEPDDPDKLDSRIGLYFALAEAEQHDEAMQVIERAVEVTPQWINAWSPETTRENPAYARVLAARAIAPLLADRPGQSWEMLHALSARAPFNLGIRTDYASSMRARGWPRRAEEELRWVLAADPDNSGALGEHAGALREMRDYRNAEAALATAQAAYPEQGRVVRATRLAEVHNMRELIVDATSGRSNGGPAGTREYGIESWLYSAPIAYDYRIFAHTYHSEARFATGTGKQHRAGLGLEYRSTAWTASGELSHLLNTGRTGVAAAVMFTPDDQWSMGGSIDTASNDTPLQARLAGINARRVSGEVSWQAHESRGMGVSFTHMNFDDGNRRHSIRARWTERVITGPVYKLEVTGALYASRNSLVGAPYFNPSSDFSPTLEFANEWLQWRRYSRAFLHRLIITVGNYRQQGFGTGPVASVRYEQSWRSDDRLTLRWGIEHGRHPYDGVNEKKNSVYLNLNWRF